MNIIRTTLGMLVCFAAWPALAQNPAFSVAQREATEIRVEKVGDNLYVLFGVGGNIAASVGEQGVLMVDAQFPEMIPKVRRAIEQLGGDGIDFAVNTHWHYDHADGNQRLGPEGTWLVAQLNSRQRMTQDNVIDTVDRPPFTQQAYPAAALPVATFHERMQLHFNGERVDLLHFGPAHTAGDTAVIFRDHNAVHLGDVFNSGYPFIDTDNGGDLDGMIAFCEAVLAELGEDAVVIPGHGAVAGHADLERYIAMLKSVRAKISALIADGASLEQVVAAAPTAEWDALYGDPTRLVNRAYVSLSR